MIQSCKRESENEIKNDNVVSGVGNMFRVIAIDRKRERRKERTKERRIIEKRTNENLVHYIVI